MPILDLTVSREQPRASAQRAFSRLWFIGWLRHIALGLADGRNLQRFALFE